MDPEGAYTRRKSFTTTSNGRVVPVGKKDPKGDIISPTNRVATDADQTRSNTRNDQYDGPVHPSKNASSGSERFIISSVAIPIELNTAEAELPEARVVPVINQAMGGNEYPICRLRSDVIRRSSAEHNRERRAPTAVHTCNLLRHPRQFRELVNDPPTCNDEDEDYDVRPLHYDDDEEEEEDGDYDVRPLHYYEGQDEDDDAGEDSFRNNEAKCPGSLNNNKLMRHPRLFRELCDQSSLSSAANSERWRNFGIHVSEIDDGGDEEILTERLGATNEEGDEKRRSEGGTVANTRRDSGNGTTSNKQYHSLYSI